MSASMMLRSAILLTSLAATIGCTRQPACISEPDFYRQAADVQSHLNAMRRVLPSLPDSADRAAQEAEWIASALILLSNTARGAAPDASQTFGDAATLFDRVNPSRHDRYVQALTDTDAAIDSFIASRDSPFCPTDH